MLRSLTRGLVIYLALAVSPSLADVPVEEGNVNYNSVQMNNNSNQPLVANDDQTTQINTQDSPPIDTSNLSYGQRLSRVEQLINHLQSLNSNQQIQNLQQQVQDLQGKLDEANHQIEVLQANEKQNLQDVTNQLAQLKTKPAAPVATNSNKTDTASDTPASADADQELYNKAYNLIKSKQYKVGSTQMKQYLKKFPQGKSAANANYWLGELAMLDNNNAAAKTYFGAVLTHNPSKNKAADTHLKLALLAANSGEAKKHYQIIIKQYPDTLAAKTAKQKIHVA